MPIITTTKQMRPRDTFDFYPTPRPYADQMLDLVGHFHEPPYVLDPGAGTGVFGDAVRAAYPEAVIAGTDLRPLPRPVSYDYWQTGVDFLKMRPAPVFDLVVGNPPYKFAEQFVRLSMASLREGGRLVFLLRLAFLESERRLKLWRDYPLKEVWVFPKRPSFTGNGKSDATAYAAFVWVNDVWHRDNPRIRWLIPTRSKTQPMLL